MTPRKRLLALAALIASTLSAAASASVMVSVTLDTSSLAATPGSAVILDLQLNDGSGTNDANNTAAITDLNFGTGAAVGDPTVGGGASGTIAGGVGLTDNVFLSFFDQAFQPGSLLSFNLSLSTNPDAGPTPDQFSFSLFDAAGNQISTTGLLSAFLVIDINALTPIIQTFAGSGDFAAIGAPTIGAVAPAPASVPEPTTLALLGMAAVALCLSRRCKRGASAQRADDKLSGLTRTCLG
jgi:hypothetical protein